MIARTHVAPFLREEAGRLEVDFLTDPDGRVARFLDRLCRLVRRLEGCPRGTVAEALRRQERRIRDARRLAGIRKTLLDLSVFRPPPGAERAAEVRDALFAARGRRWPPVPGDHRLPYQDASAALGLAVEEVDRLLYADESDAHVLVRAPRLTGRRLLARYNLDLARAVLLDAERVEVTARGGWRDIFRAVKLARLMYRLEPLEKAAPGDGAPETAPPGGEEDPRPGTGGAPRKGARSPVAGRGPGYRLELTGPAAAFVTRPQRYGARFVRVVPAVARAPGWRIEATVVRGERRVPYAITREAPLGGWRRPGRPSRYDSRWERDLAEDFRAKLGDEREGWTLTREDTPVPLGEELFLPDFTVRHRDGRTALIEVVGFWTPEYLAAKLRKVRAARLDHLVLVAYRGLAAGGGADGEDARGAEAGGRPDEDTGQGGGGEDGLETVGAGAVVWFARRPLIGPVMDAVERVAR